MDAAQDENQMRKRVRAAKLACKLGLINKVGISFCWCGHHAYGVAVPLHQPHFAAIASVAGAATLLWSAQVSGEDEVTVVVLNASPLLVDLPSGKMRLVVTHVEAL